MVLRLLSQVLKGGYDAALKVVVGTILREMTSQEEKGL
jgi:hypothetical protein